MRLGALLVESMKIDTQVALLILAQIVLDKMSSPLIHQFHISAQVPDFKINKHYLYRPPCPIRLKEEPSGTNWMMGQKILPTYKEVPNDIAILIEPCTSHHHKNAFLCTNGNSQRSQLANEQWRRQLAMLALNGISKSCQTPQKKSKDCDFWRWWMTSKKQSFLDTTGQLHIWSYNTKKTHATSRQTKIPEWRWGR